LAQRRRRGRQGQNSLSNNDLKRFSEKIFEMRTPLLPRIGDLVKEQGTVASGKNSNDCKNGRDKASQKLFRFSNESAILGSSATLRSLLTLLDNYDPDVTRAERETTQERQEIQAFMDALMNTNDMKEAHKLLKSKGLFSGDYNSFKGYVKDLWFGLFDNDGNKRTNVLGSSAFEHVFLGETKRRDIKGAHNWFQIYKEEKWGNLNYLGQSSKVVFANDVIGLKANIKWDGLKKCGVSFLIGTTPEFEIALATVCFKARKDGTCRYRLGNKTLTLKNWSIQNDHLSTAFPLL